MGENTMSALATIDDLKGLFLGNIAFPESKTEEFEKQLLAASDYLRVKYIETDIDEFVDNSETAKNVVANIVANIVKRSYVSGVSSVPEQEVSQFSQGAGPYNMSFSPVSSGSGYYLRKDEIDLLRKIFGIKRRAARIHNMYKD